VYNKNNMFFKKGVNMRMVYVFLSMVLTMAMLTACSKGFEVNTGGLPPTGAPAPSDDWLIVDRAVVVVSQNPDGTYTAKILPKIFGLFVSTAYAYTGAAAPQATLNAITYNNPASTVGFTLSQATTAGSYTGDILSFGNFAITGLDDNTLNKCSVSGVDSGAGTAKCTRAAIRVYSATGNLNSSTGVFCNATDNYCVPLTVNSVAVGVGVANAAYAQNLTIASNKNRLRVTDFTTAQANFPVAMDMSNAGSGSYSATLIVEYVLRIP
jgi:hypothetical protein